LIIRILGEVLVIRGSVNRGDEDEGIWLMGFIHIYKIEPLAISVSGAGKALWERRE
jgi:hypothetical protein